MENKNSQSGAFPIVEPNGYSSIEPGLTKRELIAAMALQGLLANPDYNCPSRPEKLPIIVAFANTAIHYADALLAELSKP